MTHRLPDPLREQGMVLAQVGTHDEGRLKARQIGNRQAEPAHALERRELGVTQPVIDVLAAEAAHQLARQIQLFDCRVRADQRPDGLCAALGTHALQAVGHVLQRGLPIHLAPLPALLDHRAGQTIRPVQGLIGADQRQLQKEERRQALRELRRENRDERREAIRSLIRRSQ